MYLTSIRLSRLALVLFVATGGGAALLACGDDSSNGPTTDSGVDGGFVDSEGPDASKPRADGGFLEPDGGVIREDRFVMKVVSFTPGECAGFGVTEMPDVILGPPVGAGDLKGGLDVVTLGIGGEIVVSFEPNAIVDGPGADFIVFENAFYAGGNPSSPSADLGEVSVSEDGVTWKTYECKPSPSAAFGKCAGWHPVYSAPGNGISPVDPAKAGGEAYDLSELGIGKARFVRIKDTSTEKCEGQPKPNNIGFDLDAIAIVNAETP
jgi:hypothetical protein